MEIVPAILPQSCEDLEGHLTRLAAVPEIKWVQIDSVDGKFASPACWPYMSGDSFPAQLPELERFRYDLDLMVVDPERSALAWITAGASRVTIHAESATDLAATINHIKEQSGNAAPELLSIGLALGVEAPLALIEPYLDRVEYVQLMGIAKVGKQKQPFDPRVLERIKTLRAKYPDLVIQIDGGVTQTTALLLIAAGASRLIVGHDLFDAPDLAGELHTLYTLATS